MAADPESHNSPAKPEAALIVSVKPGPARIMSATPESPAKMATKPADAPLRPGLIACVLDAPLVSVRGAGIPRAAALTIPESRPLRVNLLESSHVSADNPEPLHLSAVHAESAPEPTPSQELAESAPEPAPSQELAESAPEPAPSQELAESAPEPAPSQELAESAPEPAPSQELAESAPEPAPSQELAESTPEPAPSQELAESAPEPALSPELAESAHQLVPPSSPSSPLVPPSSPSPLVLSSLALSERPRDPAPPEFPLTFVPSECPLEVVEFTKNFHVGSFPPLLTETPDPPWPMESPDSSWLPEALDLPWIVLTCLDTFATLLKIRLKRWEQQCTYTAWGKLCLRIVCTPPFAPNITEAPSKQNPTHNSVSRSSGANTWSIFSEIASAIMWHVSKKSNGPFFYKSSMQVSNAYCNKFSLREIFTFIWDNTCLVSFLTRFL